MRSKRVNLMEIQRKNIPERRKTENKDPYWECAFDAKVRIPETE